MTNQLLLAGIVLGSLFAGCNKDDGIPRNCGPKKKFELTVTAKELTDTAKGAFHSYMEGNNRIFQWSALVDYVCPDQHVKVHGYVVALSATSPVNARGRVNWYFLFEHELSTHRNGYDFSMLGEIGLKQAFGEDTASFVPVVEVFFPTKGSYTADTNFLKYHINYVQILADYYEYKP